MKSNLFSVIFLIGWGTLFSQLGPGYTGKRVQGGYGFAFSPALTGSNANGNSIFGSLANPGNATTGVIAFNTLHEAFLEFAFRTRMMLGASARFYKTTYDNGKDFERYNIYGNSGTPYYPLEEHPRGFYNIQGINYSLYLKLYFGNYIAPWGKYLMFGPTFRTFSCTYGSDMRIKMRNGFNSEEFYETNFGPQGTSFKRLDFLIGLGRNRILYKRISLDYGFNMNVMALFLSLYDAVGITDIFATSHYIDNTNYIQSTAPSRVRGVNKLNAFVKVGFLIL